MTGRSATGPSGGHGRPAVTLIARGAALLLVWLALTGGSPALLIPGLAAAGIASWVSLRLAPPGAGRLRPLYLLRLGARLAGSTLLGGVDVAGRALSPSLPLAPGLIRYRSGLPPGRAREGFRALSGLQPGALPFEAEDGEGWLVHCLDTGQPIARMLAEDECRFRRAFSIGTER